ncbi:MAG: hypothetical protein RAK18_04440, partial [Conexivisphaerales archaeon]|nr:hypothetical protein [Conexivisphaerales archaeon]
MRVPQLSGFLDGYGGLRGLTPRDSLYLYLSYAEGLLNYLFNRRNFITIGQFLRRDVVVIDRRGIKYYVRARSDVLGYVAA